jgi:zinc transport system substrate-binding protein
MRSRLTLRLVPVTLFLSLLAACAPQQVVSPAKEALLHVTVSIVPQQYFVERIGGEHVSVNVMVLPGSNPETYEPRPEQMQALREADAYMAIGVPFETVWMERIRSANPEMMIVDTTQGIERMPMPSHHDGQGSQGGQGENLDPHIWTSPRLAIIQSRTICDALVKLDPEHEGAYTANLDRFVSDIEQLEASIRETLSGVKNRTFMVFHPSWGYFARDFGLDMLAVEVEGKEPSASEMAALITEARQKGIKVILAQPEFSTQSAQTIAQEIGGEVVLIDPLAPDWLDNLRQVADTLARVLGSS